MKLAAMRYKNYIWPHNPRVYSIEYQRRISVYKVPFGRYHLQDLGLTRRVMKGEGEFVGSGAYEEFKKLASVFYEDGPGLLTHPVWQTTHAYFVGLSLKQEPRENYVRYTFEFWENYAGYASELSAETDGRGTASTVGGDAAARYYTVIKGDTMWGIAQTYGVELTSLIELNPQIKNPNLIFVGQQVRIA